MGIEEAVRVYFSGIEDVFFYFSWRRSLLHRNFTVTNEYKDKIIKNNAIWL